MERLASIKKANDDNTIANIFFSLGIIATLVAIYNYNKRIISNNTNKNQFNTIKDLEKINKSLKEDLEKKTDFEKAAVTDQNEIENSA
jgi:hypothetical protein